MAARWENILKNGLLDETRKELIIKYPPPDNCVLLSAPKVNPEVKVAVPPQTLRRDDRLATRQSQIGASLAAIGATITLLLKKGGGENTQHIAMLCDAGRLLADVHHSETDSRRDLLSINLNKSLKDTLHNVCVDGLLFGGNLEERVKTSKELEKSGALLKQDKPKTYYRNPSQFTAGPLNARSPLRHARWGPQSGRQQWNAVTHPQPRKAQPPRRRQDYPRPQQGPQGKQRSNLKRDQRH